MITFTCGTATTFQVRGYERDGATGFDVEAFEPVSVHIYRQMSRTLHQSILLCLHMKTSKHSVHFFVSESGPCDLLLIHPNFPR